MRVSGWVSTLAAAASVTFLALNAALASAASIPEDFVGRWRSLENPANVIRFDTAEGNLLGSRTIYYTYPNGQPTGTKVDFYWTFTTPMENGGIRGRLESFDTHYNCYLFNGESTIEKTSENEIKMVYPRIVFTIQETYPGRRECVITQRFTTIVRLERVF